MFRSTITIALVSLLAGAFTMIQAAELPLRGPIPFGLYDKNGDGMISENEFNTVRAQRQEQREAEGRPMRNASNAPQFSDVDADGNGAISKEELQKHQAARMNSRGGGMGPR